MKTQQVLLQLIVPAGQASLLSDFLLAERHTPFFTAVELAGYGQPHEHLTPDEQVEGAQRKIKFELELPQADAEPLLARLHEALPSLTVAYRLLPVLQQGSLGTD